MKPFLAKLTVTLIASFIFASTYHYWPKEEPIVEINGITLEAGTILHGGACGEYANLRDKP